MKIQAFIITTCLLFIIHISTHQVWASGVETKEHDKTRKRLVPKQILVNKKKQPTTQLTTVPENSLNDFQRNLSLIMKDLQGVFGFISSDSGGYNADVDEMSILDDDDDVPVINQDYFVFGLILGTIFPPAIPVIWVLWLLIAIYNTVTHCDPTPSPTSTSPTKSLSMAPSLSLSNVPSGSPTESAIPTVFPSVVPSMAPSLTNAPSEAPAP